MEPLDALIQVYGALILSANEGYYCATMLTFTF